MSDRLVFNWHMYCTYFENKKCRLIICLRYMCYWDGFAFLHLFK